jgi:hypothetical protein
MAELLPQLDRMRSKLRLVNTATREIALRREEDRRELHEEREIMFRHPAVETWEVSCDEDRPTGRLEPTRSTNRRRAS